MLGRKLIILSLASCLAMSAFAATKGHSRVSHRREATTIKASSQQKVNLNTADAETLQQVKGIGPKRAEAIVQYRAKNGPFASIDDLTHIKGIGAKRIKKIVPQLTI